MINDLETDAASAHALFESYAGMEGFQVAASAPARSTSPIGILKRVYPGLLAAATVGLAATWLSQHYAAPVMLFALLIGMAFRFLHEEGPCVAGIEVSSKTVLRIGVALLGARITFDQITSLGGAPIATVLVAVASTIAFGSLAARALGLKRSFGVLSGGAVGICGASAALAIASVLPRDPDRERDTILVVVSVTALSTLAMILYPILAVTAGLDHVQAGVFLGGTVHDVAQVVGAGYSISPKTGDVATYVKLLRVSLLVPVVLVVALAARRGGKALGNEKPPVPLFLIGFAGLVVANSLGLLPKFAADAAGAVSRACLVTAIAALGMKTSFKALATVGWRPIALMVGETLWISAVVLGAILLTSRP